MKNYKIRLKLYKITKNQYLEHHKVTKFKKVNKIQILFGNYIIKMKLKMKNCKVLKFLKMIKRLRRVRKMMIVVMSIWIAKNKKNSQIFQLRNLRCFRNTKFKVLMMISLREKLVIGKAL